MSHARDPLSDHLNDEAGFRVNLPDLPGNR
jgi:hypothetical protein